MARVKAIIVGTGGMARWHIRTMLKQKRTTDIVGFVEISDKSRAAVQELYAECNLTCPPFYETIRALAKDLAPDAAFICTPHKFHFGNARDCLKQGMDVLIEKPMVMNASEARRLIKLRDQTGKLVMVAFPGSLSPAVQKARKLIASGKIGKISGISAAVHQRWKAATAGAWRQVPEVSGGGFLFDTGSHMINTVVELMGDDVAEVSAIFDYCGAPVEINSSVSGRCRNGIIFSLCGAGDSVHCTSRISVMGDKGILEVGIWGEYLRLMLVKDREFKPVKYRCSHGPWEEFLRVRDGKAENPCPPEVGLRFAKLMDMVRKSAETGRTVKAR